MKNSAKWEVITGFNGRYLVSDCGEVMSIHISKSGVKSSKILRPRIHNGYLRVALQINGTRAEQSIHRLVASAFIPNNNNFPQVNHKDGNKINNKSSNLEWCTPSQNGLHSYKSGLSKPKNGETHGRSKLTIEQVAIIRKLYIPYKVSQQTLADAFGVTQTTIGAIISNKLWK